MTVLLDAVAIHVANVWQTCEWYRQVFGLAATVAPDAQWARLSVDGQQLAFVAHEAQEVLLGPRRLNSFLYDPPGFHLRIVAADVAEVFASAVAQGAIVVFDLAPDARGRLTASLRDLNGILIYLTERA